MGDNSEVVIDAAELQTILDDLSDKKRSVSEANGKLRESIKQLIKDSSWHPQALATIRSIDAKSETERADFLRTFKPMFDAMFAAYWEDELSDLLKGIQED